MKSLFDWLTGPLMSGLLPFFKFFGRMFNPLIAVVLSAYEALQWLYRTFTGQELELGKLTVAYDAIKTATAGAAFGSFPGPIQSVMQFVNYVVPITEALILISLLCVFYILAIAFRVVKSWIPTVN